MGCGSTVEWEAPTILSVEKLSLFAMTNKCFVCDGDVDETSDEVSRVTEKGIASLVTASRERKDEKSNQLKGVKSLLIHKACRKLYTRRQSIAADAKRQAASKSSQLNDTVSLRSSKPPFDFKTNCFLCAKPADPEKWKKVRQEQRRMVYSVRNMENKLVCVQEQCINAGLARNDVWGEEVVKRLSFIIDLVAEEAVYHSDCYKSFTKALYKKKLSENDDYISKGMNEIYLYMEENGDCQFSMVELMAAVTGTKLDWRTVKAKLIEKYEDRITIKPGRNRFDVPIICFSDAGYKVLNDAWYEQERKKNYKDERMRIVKKAAAIIRQDIQSEIYDSRTYPCGDEFLQDADSVTPTLRMFLEGLMMKSTKRVETTTKKCIAIGHAITTIVRPRTFSSSLLSSLSLLLYRRFASKTLINMLASMGFCSSYYEAQVLEMSCIANAKPIALGGSFNQFVFDNADFNVCTIDGLNTFHSMGGIRCITPASSIEKGSRIPRLSRMPTSSETGKVGIIPLKTFQAKIGSLRNVIVKDLYVPEEPANPFPHDTLWLLAQKQKIKVPQWKGYMNTLTKGDYSEKTKVVPLPFINAPPSNYDTVYTALTYATEICEKVNQHSVIVTFDQPLYWKAREIVADAPSDSQLSNCVVRLGGFHLLMSYIGCIGYLMGGSGLKELLSTVYAAVSVEKMLNGHAFSRAVRGHLLTQTALSDIIFNHIEITDTEQGCVNEIMSTIWDEPPPLASLNENPYLISLAKKFGEALQHLSGNGRTARLWIQYFHMVNLLKEYIHAERSGDWDAHLICVKRMIPYFHASGHFPYAKSCHLYIQDMMDLPSRLTQEEYKQFVDDGAFTMRRSDRFWSGVWSDMTIETNLMRSFSAQGGVKRGRGVSDSVISKWVVGISATHDVCTSLEEFCGVLFTSSEQHKDFGEARIKKDMADIDKLTTWLHNHPPFPKTSDIMSIATGVVGDESVTCFDALKHGKQAMNKIVTLPFSEIKLSRKDRALPISSVSSSIKLYGENVAVDPYLLFQRISIAKSSNEDLKEYLRYELAPFPLALFNEGGMRKTNKSVLYKLFEPTNKRVDLPDLDLVIDGGFLLHKVIWQRGSSVSDICHGYVKFVKTHYPVRTCTVVFDGYNNSPNSTKAAEQERRYRMKKSVDINFNLDTVIPVNQELFLSNQHNKDRLINLLRSTLHDNGITTRQASCDADVLIVSTAIEHYQNETSNVAVLGEDVDLAVLLKASTPNDRNILFIKPGRKTVPTNIYSTQQMQQMGLKEILFLHAFTGCDSTSATFRKSKLAFIKLYQNHQDVRKAAEVFHNPSSSHADVEEAGKLCMLKWFGAPAKESSLNTYRYHSFLKSVTNIKPDLSSLPPSEGATKEHSFRTFHQVQLWLGNQLPPELWGWELKTSILVPVTTKEPAAPKEILDLMFCRCTTDCSSARCGCKKMAMRCSPLCQNCHGKCINGVPILIHEDDEEDIEDILPKDKESDIQDRNEDDNGMRDEDMQCLMPSVLELHPEDGPSCPKRYRPM